MLRRAHEKFLLELIAPGHSPISREKARLAWLYGDPFYLSIDRLAIRIVFCDMVGHGFGLRGLRLRTLTLVCQASFCPLQEIHQVHWENIHIRSLKRNGFFLLINHMVIRVTNFI
jgi:hypothetical protein